MRPTPHAFLLASASLVVVLGGCNTETVEEAADLLTEGGEIRLRETPRQPGDGAKVLIFGLDGVGAAVLEEALREGRLPRLATVTGRVAEAAEAGGAAGAAEAGGAGSGAAGGSEGLLLPHGWLAPPVLSVLPSITLAAWTTLFTGEPPGRTGVPGNEWFERSVDAFHAPAPVSVSGEDDALGVMTEGLMGEWIRVPTLFERADVLSHVSFLPVHRGADLLTVPSAGDLAALLGAFSEGVVTDEPADREVYSAVDRASADAAVSALEENGVPDLQVVYFPGVDLYIHAATNPVPEQARYLTEVVDPAIATVLAAYRRAGALERTWILVVADHGHTAVPADERHALGSSPTLAPGALLDTLGWRVRPAETDVEDGDHQAVVAFQGAFAYVYLADRSTCPAEGDGCDWTRAPAPADVDSVAAAFHRHAATAEADAAPLQMVLVPRRDSAGRLTAIERWTPDGPAPLGAALRPEEEEAFVRLEDRLRWLLDGPEGRLSGDVVLMARSGAWVPDEDRFYFSHPYHSWHGSAHRQDSEIPLLAARAGMTGEAVRDSVLAALPDHGADQTDFTPLVLELLGVQDRARTPFR